MLANTKVKIRAKYNKSKHAKGNKCIQLTIKTYNKNKAKYPKKNTYT